MRCTGCGGVWHPATGAEYSSSHRLCIRCEREFWTWARGRIHWLASIADGHHAPGKKSASASASKSATKTKRKGTSR